jgi:ABC-type oligopeptide transport system substrate-binding subunit
MKKFLASSYLFPFLCFAVYAVYFSDLPAVFAKQHGLAMHGDLKYKPEEPFSYVNPKAPKGGEARFAVVGTFDSTNPFITKGTPPAGLSLFSEKLVFESLMKRSADEPFSLYGLIAESIDIAPDRSWIIFYLHPKAQWPDGRPITAADVIFSYQTLRDKGRLNLRLYYSKVATVDALDERTVKFVFKKEKGQEQFDPEAPLLIAMMSILPKHLLEGKDFEKVTLEPMVGSGPYRIKELKPGKYILYERRPDYWGKDLAVNAGQYNFDRIRFDFYRDSHVAFEAFKAGEYDFRIEENITLWHKGYDFPALKRGQVNRLELDIERPVGLHAFVFNTRRPLFRDKRVRQALNYAFDFGWLNKNLFYDAYRRSRSYYQCSDLESKGKPNGRELMLLQLFKDQIPPEVFEEAWQPPVYTHSNMRRQQLARAKQLLKEAGWTVDSKGQLRHLNNDVFRFEVLLYNPDDEKIALSLARHLKILGIQVDVRVVDTAHYENRRLAFDYDMIIQTWGQSESPGNEQMYYWSSAAANQPGSRNYAGIQDPVVDVLCQMIADARDRETLIAAGRALDRLLLTGYYVIPLYHCAKMYIAYWDKFGYPPYNPKVGVYLSTWWAKDSQQQSDHDQ